MNGLVILGVVGMMLVIGYVVSVLIHPYVACETCGGKGRHVGGLFSYASRPCHVCSGAGSKQRIGARVMGRGKRRVSSRRIQPPTSSFGA